jgi:hypothetical protein
MNKDMWKPGFKWHLINNNAYDIIISEAKEFNDELNSISTDLTSKSIRLITVYFLFNSYLVKHIIENPIDLKVSSLFYFLLTIIIFSALIYLLAPKNIKLKGNEPEVFIPRNLDNEEDKEYQETLIKYTQVVLYQDKINSVDSSNNLRSKLYLCCIISIAISILTGFCFIF